MIFDKEILVFDFSKISNVTGFYYLADLSSYTIVNIQCTWSNINATDGYAKYCEKNNISVVTWNESYNKLITLDIVNDSRMITVENFTSKIVGLFIEKGSITNGILKVHIFAK